LGGDAGLAIGMLLGERGQIDDGVRDAVRRLGITHLLAISGMHLTTVAGCVLLLTGRWPRRRAHALLLCLTVYTATVGDVESLTRAYLMALILIAGHGTVRPVRAVDALGKVLFIMAVAAPLSLRSVGLQLSFAATFAVLCCLPLETRSRARAGTSRVHRALRATGTALVLSVAVELFIAPLQLHHFHAISTVGPLATVAFFLPVTVVLLGAAPVAGLSAIVPAHEWPGVALGLVSTWTNAMIVACGRAAPAPLALPEPDPWLYYGGLVIGWRFRRRPVAWAAAAALVTAAFLC
jgi:competence protein ComEC